MENEEFKILDLKSFENNEGNKIYYAIVYSSYEILERVYLSLENYTYLLNHIKDTDASKVFRRRYSRKTNSWRLVYIKS